MAETSTFICVYHSVLFSSNCAILLQVRTLNIPCSPNYSFAAFLGKPTSVRDWNIQGLPSDAFSTENGVIVTKSNRWPLMVDPQGQAIKWIKNMERHRVCMCFLKDSSCSVFCHKQKLFFSSQNLKIIDLQQPDFLRTLENAVQFGSPVLLQNVQEELDPSLGPILSKSLIKRGQNWLLCIVVYINVVFYLKNFLIWHFYQIDKIKRYCCVLVCIHAVILCTFSTGNRLVIKLGDKEVEYNQDFKFYITTKLSNPHYTPEISTKTAIVNFAVKEQGLEAQLLGIVVRKERPELEEQKDKLVVNIANSKKELVNLEDKILR